MDLSQIAQSTHLIYLATLHYEFILLQSLLHLQYFSRLTKEVFRNLSNRNFCTTSTLIFCESLQLEDITFFSNYKISKFLVYYNLLLSQPFILFNE